MIRVAPAPRIENGQIPLPGHKINKEVLSPVEVPGKLVSEMLIEDRR